MKARIKNNNLLSKLNLTVFALIFATIGSYLLINSFAATNGTPACPNESAGQCRPYDDASAWNTKITNPTVDPNSSTFINAIKDNNKALTSDPDQFTPAVFVTNSSTPLKKVQLLGGYRNAYDQGDNTRVGGFEALIQNVPIDSSKVKIPNGDDAQVVFWDPATGDQWEFWQFRPAQHTNPSGVDSNTNVENYVADTSVDWVATNFTKYHTKSDSSGNKYYGRLNGGGGGRGAGTPYLAGLVRDWEITQGRIDHAISFAYQYPCCGSKSGLPTTSQFWRYPAAKSDGASASTNDPPEGARIQLDPSLTDADFTGMGLTPAAKTIAKALQEYGMYIIDNSGSSKINIESSVSANNGTGWGTTLTTSSLSSIPWDKFRVVSPPCDPTTAGCTSTTTPKPGDTNNDNLVNIVDLSTLLSHWNTNYTNADFNKDNTVNVFDLSILLSNYGK